jgi:hypothetical protein
MPQVNFDSDKQQNQTNTNNEDKDGITGWMQDTFNIGPALARKGLITVGIIALVVSLYFWAQLLL